MTETIRALGYRVVWAADVDYMRAPPIHIETDDFVLDLSGCELRASLKREYSTIEQARTQVDDYLHGWEIVIGISEHPDAVHFKYESAEVDEVEIDPETGHRVRQAEAHIEATTSLSAVPHVSRGKYPLPAHPFRVDSVVEALYARYVRYQAGRELLTSMAYFCLTVIERSAGGRKEAARKYCIAKPVFGHLGIFCSERGSKEEARKAPKAPHDFVAFSPLSQRERKWVLAAVRLIIQRTGEVAACPDEPPAEITMQDLPDLSDSS